MIVSFMLLLVMIWVGVPWTFYLLWALLLVGKLCFHLLPAQSYHADPISPFTPPGDGDFILTPMDEGE